MQELFWFFPTCDHQWHDVYWKFYCGQPSKDRRTWDDRLHNLSSFHYLFCIHASLRVLNLELDIKYIAITLR